MAKTEGWSNWTARNRNRFVTNSTRRRDLPLSEQPTIEQLKQFISSSPGPIASTMWDDGLIRLEMDSKSGKTKVEIDKAKVAEAAKQFLDQARVNKDDYQASGLTRAHREELQAMGARMTARQAENDLNHRYAAKAKAILTTAKVGGVQLTQAQRQKLHTAAAGKFTDLIADKHYVAARIGGASMSAAQAEDNRAMLRSFRENHTSFARYR